MSICQIWSVLALRVGRQDKLKLLVILAYRLIRDKARALWAIERMPRHALCRDTEALGVMDQACRADRSLKQLPAVSPGCDKQLGLGARPRNHRFAVGPTGSETAERSRWRES